MTTMPDYIEFDPDGDVTLILLNRVGDPDAKGKDTQNTDQAENWAHLDINYPAVIQMRVSSGHLILVSPVFKRLLKGGFAECHTLTSAGTAEICLPDDNPEAMQILLNIIHGHTRKVPREIKFDTLTQISILIDKYSLHEAEVSRMWELRRGIDALDLCDVGASQGRVLSEDNQNRHARK
jgi:BTB/POZ domain